MGGEQCREHVGVRSGSGVGSAAIYGIFGGDKKNWFWVFARSLVSGRSGWSGDLGIVTGNFSGRIGAMIGQILFWSFIGSVASLGGGILLALRKKAFSHEQSLLLISFAAGVLLSTAFFDLLPEAGEKLSLIGVLAGIIFLFLLEKFLWYHHHDEEHEGHRRTPVLITVGDTVHNFIDGVVIAGTFMVAPATGIVTAMAVAAHEIPHEMADFGVLLTKGWARKK